MKVKIGDIAVINDNFYDSGRHDGIIIKIIKCHVDGNYTAKELRPVGDSYFLSTYEFELVHNKWKKKYKKMKSDYKQLEDLLKEMNDTNETLIIEIQELKFNRTLDDTETVS